MSRQIKIKDISIGGGSPLVLIAGPCVIESEDMVLEHAAALKLIAANAGVPFIFKASYDKANRSSVSSFRGPGIEEGLKVLEKVKKEVGVPVLSDVHTAEEATRAAEVLDILQIPAFLCRQTDILVSAGKTGKPVNVKKGQFMSPHEMQNVVAKIESTGNKHVLLTERGTTFGYNMLVSDFRGLIVMSEETDCPIVFDATHSVQMPGGKGTTSGGDSKYVIPLSRAAVAVGCDALFLEVHKDPESAKSDGPNMIKLDELERCIEQVKSIDKVSREIR